MFACNSLLHFTEDSALISQHQPNPEQTNVSVIPSRRKTQLCKCPNFYSSEKLSWGVNFLMSTRSRVTPVHHLIEILSGCVFVVRLV